MESKHSGGLTAADLVKIRDAIAQLAQSGDPSQLMAMMNQLMHSKEGAQLVERIENQARQAGLE